MNWHVDRVLGLNLCRALVVLLLALPFVASAESLSTCEKMMDLRTCESVAQKFKAFSRWAACDEGWFFLGAGGKGAFMVEWLHRNGKSEKALPRFDTEAWAAQLLLVCAEDPSEDAFAASVLAGVNLARKAK